VSPIHLEYMRNMGTAASLTIGLAHRQGLWGMLVCHHGTPRNPGTELRVAADMIGQVVSLLLGSLGQAEVYAQRFERADTLRCLIEKLSAPVPLMDAFAAAEMELLRLVNADGVMVRIGAGVLRLGRSPPVPAAERALSVLCRESNETLVAVEDLGLRHAALADCTEAGSGALLLKLSPTGEDAILWFRPELSQTIVWAGNPNKPAETGTGRMSPRKSFAAWQEIMHGHSARWQAADLALARELETAIEAEVAQRTKAELAKLRNYDALTGLPNRRLLQSRLAEDAQHPGATATSLLFLDLDRFKAVNDTLGHAAGDTLLVQVAERLVATAGADNLVARLGGDEFVVLSHGLDHAALAAMSERIRQAIETPFEIVDRACYISVSIGIASDDELSGFDLVRAADMAMYAAKKSGGNQGMVFDQSLYDRAAGRFELEHDLRVALSRDDQLVLVYQPVFGAGSFQDVVGFEARLRWNHPRQGWIAPDLFIPLAEKSGLMPPLGHWVLTQALRQAARFRVLRPDPVLILSVNIAPLQLAYPGFYADLLGLLRGANFPAASLCLEVPEGVLVDPMTAAVIAEARGLGAHVALDDFGMGQSSLSALRRLPVDTVKLDRSFLEPGDGNAGGASFIEAVTNLAHAAGLSVIAKGVETPAQLAAAVQGGVDGVQGFLLSPPLSAEAAAALLARPPSAGVPGEVSAGVSAGGERLG
jgi:diguanylate cyclase (GGDEF)-like protein